MPRPNPLRALQSEDNLARRVAYERERRGWSYEGTAKRLTDAGCPIQSSAIFKIEKGEPRRRITVDELVGFARVFELDVEDLLIPANVILTEAVREQIAVAGEAYAAAVDAARRFVTAWTTVETLMDSESFEHGGLRDALHQYGAIPADVPPRVREALTALWNAVGEES